MEGIRPTISQYLVSTCLFIIDELNETYGGLRKEDLKIIANEKFNEMDITVRIGFPFRQRVHYTAGDTNRANIKANHDLCVESKDFIIEIKYLKNWRCSTKNTCSNSKVWNEYQKDFDWLISEIDAGNKHKRAFVIGWFNCVENFSQYMQLGVSRGSKPLLNEERFMYFPFLSKLKVPTLASDLKYNYSRAYKEIPLTLIGNTKAEYNCMFLGNKTDCFHFAIYY